MQRILVCGGRTFTNKALVWKTLDSLVSWSEPDSLGNKLPVNCTIIHGGATGADVLADGWAVANWVPIEKYPVNWGKYGLAGGPIRNKKMIEEGKPTLVVAFPGGSGTENMIQLARKAGINVLRVNDES